jgi:hypothetical protein
MDEWMYQATEATAHLDSQEALQILNNNNHSEYFCL